MTVYKYFLKTVYNKKTTIVIYLVIFMIVILMNKPEKLDSILEDKTSNIGYVDLSNDEYSKELIKFLGERNNLIQVEDNEDSIYEKLYLLKIVSFIRINENFLEEGKIDIISNDRFAGEEYIKAKINNFLNILTISSNNGNINRELLEETFNKKANIKIYNDLEFVRNENTRNLTMLLNFSSYIFISLIMTIITLAMDDFKEENLLNRVRVSGMSLVRYELQIFLGALSIGIAISSILLSAILLISRSSLDVLNIRYYILNLYIFGISIVCFNYFINNSIKSRRIKNGLSTVFSLGVSFISGSMVPQQYISGSVLKVAQFFPTFHYIKANDMLKQNRYNILNELSIQILFAVLFLILGIYFAKIKKEER